jgi:hypothetical protein
VYEDNILTLQETRQRERERGESGEGVRDTAVVGAEIFLQKVSRQWPLAVLLVVCLRKGKSLGSEAGKCLGSELCYEYRREVEEGN